MAEELKVVQDTLSRCQDLKKFITEGYQVTKTVAEECESDENGKNLVNELRDMVKDYARMERDISQYCSATEKAMNKFRVDYAKCEDDEQTPNISSIYQEMLTKLESSNNDEQIEKHKEVVDFTQTIWNLHNSDSEDAPPAQKIRTGDDDDDDEIEMTCVDESQKFICPITKGELVNPVKSKLCGHTFSRKAVEGHIKNMKGRAKCPIAGCVSSISIDDLENDNVIAFQLRKKNRAL